MSSDRLSAELPVSPESVSSCWKKKILLVSRLELIYEMDVRQSSVDQPSVCFCQFKNKKN